MVQNVQKFEKCPDYANFSQMVQNGTSLQRWGSPPPNIVVLNYDKLSMLYDSHRILIISSPTRRYG